VVALKVTDIDSTRMLIRVEQGKGRKDRHAMLSPQLLDLLRAWWREGKRRGVMLPQGWLFPSHNPVTPLSTRQMNRAVHAAAQAAEIKKRVTPHTLRHYISFLTMSGTFRPSQIFSEISPVHGDIVLGPSIRPAEVRGRP